MTEIQSNITLEHINEIINEFDSVDKFNFDNIHSLMYSVIKTQQITIREKQDNYDALVGSLDTVAKNETGAYDRDYSKGIAEYLKQLKNKQNGV